jgi:hypothetical protein
VGKIPHSPTRPGQAPPPVCRWRIETDSTTSLANERFGHPAVRILPPQPGSPTVRETAPDTRRNARQWRAFAIRWAVSRLPIQRISRRILRKAPATTANIPVFGRPVPETGFDRQCAAGAELGLYGSSSATVLFNRSKSRLPELSVYAISVPPFLIP